MDVSIAPGSAAGNSHALSIAHDSDLRTYVITHINEAIDNGWVRPYYQPVVRTLSGKLCGFEALARWEDPAHGLLDPCVFIGALEETRLIHLLDCSIIRQVCQQYRACVDNGEPTVPVSFNLSRLDFDLCDIFSIVESTAHEFGVPRRMLNIEITETVLGTDPAYMADMMRKFHEAGYQVWMDDFGSGYSTLNALKDFDFDELKIDMEFLNRFGEKSKTILASVVDMAKKLGIQTLAEGVETEEHQVYLRRIGCEKMQGYLFGKPRPFSIGSMHEFANTIGVETTAERLYFNDIGAVNTLSMSERNLTPGNPTHGYVTSMPLAITEFADGTFRIIDSNRVFREGLANVGISSVEEAERLINDTSRPLARQSRQLVETIEVEKYARLDFVAGDIACVMRAKHITTRNGKTALLVSIDDTIEQSERKRHERMDDLLAVMYTIYEHVDVIHVDKGYLEPVFGNIGLHTHYDSPDYAKATQQFANDTIYPSDRKRFLDYMDLGSIVERIEESGENFVTGFFRLRHHGGEYAWKMIGLIRLADRPDNQVMLVIRSTHWSFDGLLQATFDEYYAANPSDPKGPDLSLSDGSLWRALVHDDNVMLFWKDRERRFVGANQAFLDYYGFESASEIIGKTDEDMGWHIDPVPFMQSEQRVLNEGESAKDLVGQCIVRGEVRNIIANKRPVYRNGRIVGLVGYFTDISEDQHAGNEGNLPLRDNLTGLLNYTGLEAATWQFVDAYKRQGIDFAMISINIESFETINAEFGYSFGDKVLKRVADELVSIAGHQRVLGHVHSDRFVVLAQGDSDETLQGLCDEIERQLMNIPDIDGTPCTVYALASFARFSAIGDVDEMKRYNRDRRSERRNARYAEMHGGQAKSSRSQERGEIALPDDGSGEERSA